MGLYDREYYPEPNRGVTIGGRSLVIQLILMNVGIWLVDMVTSNKLTAIFALTTNVVHEPWMFWQVLTYGFLHDTDDLRHILFNMFGLWLFGSDLESMYGRAEFLKVYLTAIIFSGLAWLGFELARGINAQLVGASGGVTGLMLLFVLNFPQKIFYIWGIVPVRAWVLGAIWIVIDIFGLSAHGDDVAHVAHLAGAAYGYVYYRTHFTLGRLLPGSWSFPRWRPKLRLHDPEAEAQKLNAEVDQILKKISRTGEASLTKKERQTLERASRRYQQRRD